MNSVDCISGLPTSGFNGHCNGAIKPKAPKKTIDLVDIVSSGTKVVWDKNVKNTRMEQFQAAVERKYKIKFHSYWDLHDWSVKNYAKFWEEAWHYFGVICSKSYREVAKQGDCLIAVEWFSGAKMNYAENLLRFRDDHVAIIWADEDGGEEKVTYAQMYEEVKVYAAALKKNGLQMGDRVACYMSNRKEAVFAMLAATSMGAIWGGPLPFYGSKAAAKIVNIMTPKFLFTVDRMKCNGTESSLLENLTEIVKGSESLEKVIIVPTKEETLSKDISFVDKSCFLQTFLESGLNADGKAPDLTFEQLPFNYPVFINFTSGTTGLPKGLIHSAGTFLPVLRDFGLHCNFSREDVLLSIHPCGWNLWNLYVATFALGSTVLLYDGLPCYLSPTYMWDVVSKYKVSFMFFVTSIVDKMEKDNCVPAPDCNLDHLKMVAIGASPVKLQNIDYFFDKVKKDLFVGCLYGATEVIGVFSGFDLNTSMYSAEIQAPALGVDIKCFDANGKSVIGQRGELVIATPTPSFPVGVWNDSKQRGLQELYLNQFPGVWTQNDEVWIDPTTKGIIIIGRSDETIKQFGERFSSEVIYWAIHTIEEIADTICVQQVDNRGDMRAVLFVKARDGQYSQNLVQKIRDRIMEELTVLHVPEVILPMDEIPYNLNGKRMERLVRNIISTNHIPETNNIRNPECLAAYRNIPELMNYKPSLSL